MDIRRGGGYLNRASTSVTFTGASGLGATGTNATVFTITGEILIVALVPFCTDGLGESAPTAQVSLGVTSAATLFIAATDSTAIDTNEIWVDNTPDANGIALPAALKDIVITDNIIVASTGVGANTNSGTLRFDMYWMPLSSNGNVS